MRIWPDELRYVVQARYPVSAKHRGGTFTKARTEDQFDVVLPAFGRGYGELPWLVVAPAIEHNAQRP